MTTLPFTSFIFLIFINISFSHFLDKVSKHAKMIDFIILIYSGSQSQMPEPKPPKGFDISYDLKRSLDFMKLAMMATQNTPKKSQVLKVRKLLRMLLEEARQGEDKKLRMEDPFFKLRNAWMTY